MPESYNQPSRGGRTWANAAEDRQVVLIRCAGCRRQVYYLPEDLVRVLGPFAQVAVPPFPCAKCRTSEYMRVSLIFPNAEQAMTLRVRRPVRQITKWLWETVPMTKG